ncbi:hypothetical protein VTI74DRAFT_457 [Chaetomium olivicolor]
MPSPFDNIPPFPAHLPLAPIATVSHQKLLVSDPTDSALVLHAAQTHGFFYLDLRSTPTGRALLTESSQLLTLSKSLFALPPQEKQHYVLQRGVSLFGYKPAGTVKTTDASQRPDTTEMFNITKDHLHGIDASRSYPAGIEQHKQLLRSFTLHGHEVGMLILAVLAPQLGLEPDAFTQLNLFDRPSGDHCRLTHKPPSPRPSSSSDEKEKESAIGLPSHTDFGSVTILFNWLGGLQIESRTRLTDENKRAWEWVQPLPGHAVVNLGTVSHLFPSPGRKQPNTDHPCSTRTEFVSTTALTSLALFSNVSRRRNAHLHQRLAQVGQAPRRARAGRAGRHGPVQRGVLCTAPQ